MKSQPFHRILVATDLESSSAEALRVAHSLTDEVHAALGVVNVSPLDAPDFIGAPPVSAARRADEERARGEQVAEQVREVTGRERHAYAAFVDRGEIASMIVERARAFRADLVVVGTHGRKGAARLVLGSTAAEVVRTAPCSVLVAKPSPPGGPIVVGSDLGDAASRAVGIASSLAAKEGKPLVALHALELELGDLMVIASAIFGGAVPAPVDGETAHTVESVAYGALSAELTKAGIEARVEIVEGAPATRIVARGRELGASLVVVGTHGRGRLARLALGSVAERVVRDGASSVLVVR